LNVSDSASRRVVVAYVGAMTGLSVASIAVLYGLFVSGFPAFLSGLFENPAAAVQNDPVSPALALAGLGLVVLLVALVVVFGARHGPAAVGERSSGGHRRSDEK
jgi:hypothetical protein